MASKRSSRSSASTSANSAPKADDVKAGSESKVFLIQSSLIPDDLEIITLTHPRTGTGAKFLIHKGQVFEITSFQERYRSWLIGQSVVSNGNLYMTTRIDPLFLLVPQLVAQCKERAVPIDHLLVDDDGGRVKNGRLLDVFTDDLQLQLVADVKRSGDIKALKYNEEKTLDWLQRKCQKLTSKLVEHKIHCGTAATSATFVKSEKMDMDKDSSDDVLRYAYFIVADYVSEDLAKKLLQRLGIELKAASAVEKSSQAVNPMKRSISAEDDETADQKPVAKKVAAEVKVSSKTKAMAKAASGTKSISSFFKKAA